MRLLAALSLSLLALAGLAEPAARRAPPPTPTAPRGGPELQFRTERTVVFKDGYGLMVKRGRAVADARGRVFTEQVPEGAILGAFWASAITKGVEVQAMRAEELPVEVTRRDEAPCASLPKLLSAHAGRRVTLVLEDGSRVTGKLRASLEGAGLVVIDTGKGRSRALRASAIKELEGALNPRCASEVTSTETRRRLTLELGERAAGRRVDLRLFYFAPGIRWIPTYRVDLHDARADVSLTGEVLNELEDLDGPVDLVVGVPHFRFKNAPSPLSLEKVLRNALSTAAPQLMGNEMSNAMFSSRAREVFRPAPASQAADPELRTAEQHELFVYKVPRLALPKGARAQVPLLTHRAGVKHVYTVDVRAPDHANRPDLTRNAVWHKLELTNPGGSPWTTGPALILKDGLPLGQDLLTYTPAKASTLLPVTVAVGVRAELDDEELRRERNAETLNGRAYTRVHRRASLKITSHRPDVVEVRATVRARGRSASKLGHYETGDGVNPGLVVEKTLRLKAGGRDQVRFDYTTLQ
jgi:hypothetical protein